jgi:hypothetical protein
MKPTVFPQRTYFQDKRSPLSLVTFVRVRHASGPLKIVVTVQTDRASSRQMSIHRDGSEVASYNTPTFSKGERDCWATVLARREEIVIGAANHIPASKPELPKMEPATNIKISVRLPEFLRSVKAYEVTETAEVSFPCSIANGTALLKMDSIESGRAFVLRHQRINEVADPIQMEIRRAVLPQGSVTAGTNSSSSGSSSRTMRASSEMILRKMILFRA